MSFQAFFEQTQAVAQILDEWAKGHDEDPSTTEGLMSVNDEQFTAVWQAVELLSRAATVLHPMVQLEMSKLALNLPDPVERKGTLYGPDGQAL